MKFIVLSVLSLFLVSACATPEQRAAHQKMVDDQDHAECVKLGFKPKTDAYGDCRLRLKEMRVKANTRPVYYPSIGIGYGHFHHRHRYHY